jgi:sugar O-acyltransferase (sialic acid O-acetyltransferase NeuD family)
MNIKRLLDLSLSIVAAIVLLPVFLSVAVLLLITQGRPVLFTQPRVGFQGRIFRMYKFRTMKPLGSEEDPHSMNRLTFIGRLIRAMSFDELPSLLNIIKGEMSLVGPRPLLVQYLDRYSEEEFKRHDALPGLTGWAQINGRNTLSWGDKFKHDIWYVNNQSFWLDLKIIFLTVKTMLVREGINASGSEIMEEFDPGLYVFGGGGHAKVVISCLQARGLRVMGIFDDNSSLHGKKIMSVPVLGAVEDSRKYKIKKAVIGIGSNSIREKLALEFPYNWISVIHPDAIVHSSVELGKGSVVFPGAVINADAKISEHAIVNTGAIIEHDCVVESFAHLCPGTILAGGGKVGKGSFLGAGVTVIPGKKVGSYSTLGAGAVVTDDIPDLVTAVGVPAKIIKNNISHIQRKKA